MKAKAETKAVFTPSNSTTFKINKVGGWLEVLAGDYYVAQYQPLKKKGWLYCFCSKCKVAPDVTPHTRYFATPEAWKDALVKLYPKLGSAEPFAKGKLARVPKGQEAAQKKALQEIDRKLSKAKVKSAKKLIASGKADTKLAAAYVKKHTRIANGGKHGKRDAKLGRGNARSARSTRR